MRTDTGHRIYIHNTNCSLVKSNGTSQYTLRLRVTHGSNRIDLRTRLRYYGNLSRIIIEK